MRPAFPGLILYFLQDGHNFPGEVGFSHDWYHVTLYVASGFRARAQSEERDDLYLLDAGILFHPAIIKYRSEPVIQSQAFACTVVE